MAQHRAQACPPVRCPARDHGSRPRARSSRSAASNWKPPSSGSTAPDCWSWSTSTTKTAATELDPKWQEAFVRFWGLLAGRLSRFDPDLTILEIVNEPVFDRREEEWNTLNARLAAAIRQQRPGTRSSRRVRTGAASTD